MGYTMKRAFLFTALTFIFSIGSARAQSSAAKRPVPDEAAQKRATDLAKDVYGEEVAKAKTTKEKSELAAKLIAKAGDNGGDPAAQYVLLRVARDIATQAKDGPAAFRAVDDLDAAFRIDPISMKSAILLKMASGARTEPEHRFVAKGALEVITRAVADDGFSCAEQLGSLAMREARKLEDKALVLRVERLMDEVNHAAKEFALAKEAKAALRQSPNDPQANLVVGRYMCFVKGDWDKGLPMLALGSDEALKAMAMRELKGTASPAEQSSLGDAWWDLAERQVGRSKKAVQKRAAYWYQSALPDLRGIAKDRVEKRLKATAQDEGGNLPTAGASVYLAELEASQIRLIPEDQHDVKTDAVFHGKRSEHNLWEHPPQKGSSHIQYELGGRFSVLQGAVGIGDVDSVPVGSPLTFRIVGDGKPLWQSDALQARGAYQAFRVKVAKVKSLELFVDCPGWNGAAHAMWLDPVLHR
jgi:hypothetical protein